MADTPETNDRRLSSEEVLRNLIIAVQVRGQEEADRFFGRTVSGLNSVTQGLARTQTALNRHAASWTKLFNAGTGVGSFFKLAIKSMESIAGIAVGASLAIAELAKGMADLGDSFNKIAISTGGGLKAVNNLIDVYNNLHSASRVAVLDIRDISNAVSKYAGQSFVQFASSAEKNVIQGIANVQDALKRLNLDGLLDQVMAEVGKNGGDVMVRNMVAEFGKVQPGDFGTMAAVMQKFASTAGVSGFQLAEAFKRMGSDLPPIDRMAIEWNTAVSGLTTTFQQLQIEVYKALGPAAVKFVTDLVSMLGDVQKWIESNSESLHRFVYVAYNGIVLLTQTMGTLGAATIDVAGFVTQLAGSIAGIFSGDFGKSVSQLGEGASKVGRQLQSATSKLHTKSFEEISDYIKNAKYEQQKFGGSIDESKGSVGKLDESYLGLIQKVKKLAAEASNWANMFDASVKRAESLGAALQLAGRVPGLEKDISAIAAASAKQAMAAIKTTAQEKETLNILLQQAQAKLQATPVTDQKSLEARRNITNDIMQFEKQIAEAQTRQTGAVQGVIKSVEQSTAGLQTQVDMYEQGLQLLEQQKQQMTLIMGVPGMTLDVIKQQVQMLDEQKTILQGIYTTQMQGIDARQQDLEVQLQQAKTKQERMDTLVAMQQLETQRQRKQMDFEYKINDLKTKQLQITKEVREGYLDAIGAMALGAGKFEKFLITQERNTGRGLREGLARPTPILGETSPEAMKSVRPLPYRWGIKGGEIGFADMQGSDIGLNEFSKWNAEFAQRFDKNGAILREAADATTNAIVEGTRQNVNMLDSVRQAIVNQGQQTQDAAAARAKQSSQFIRGFTGDPMAQTALENITNTVRVKTTPGDRQQQIKTGVKIWKKTEQMERAEPQAPEPNAPYKLPEFRVGGYTGVGRSSEIAGNVHKNEIVFQSSIVGKHKNFLMNLREGLDRGYQPHEIMPAQSQIAKIDYTPVETALSPRGYELGGKVAPPIYKGDEWWFKDKKWRARHPKEVAEIEKRKRAEKQPRAAKAKSLKRGDWIELDKQTRREELYQKTIEINNILNEVSRVATQPERIPQYQQSVTTLKQRRDALAESVYPDLYRPATKDDKLAKKDKVDLFTKQPWIKNIEQGRQQSKLVLDKKPAQTERVATLEKLTTQKAYSPFAKQPWVMKLEHDKEDVAPAITVVSPLQAVATNLTTEKIKEVTQAKARQQYDLFQKPAWVDQTKPVLGKAKADILPKQTLPKPVSKTHGYDLFQKPAWVDKQKKVAGYETGEKVKAFNIGGYTGNVGAKTIAGVVHGGEIVFEKPLVDKYGDALMSLRRKMQLGEDIPGFEEGGKVKKTRRTKPQRIQTPKSPKESKLMGGGFHRDVKGGVLAGPTLKPSVGKDLFKEKKKQLDVESKITGQVAEQNKARTQASKDLKQQPSIGENIKYQVLPQAKRQVELKPIFAPISQSAKKAAETTKTKLPKTVTEQVKDLAQASVDKTKSILPEEKKTYAPYLVGLGAAYAGKKAYNVVRGGYRGARKAGRWAGQIGDAFRGKPRKPDWKPTPVAERIAAARSASAPEGAGAAGKAWAKTKAFLKPQAQLAGVIPENIAVGAEEKAGLAGWVKKEAAWAEQQLKVEKLKAEKPKADITKPAKTRPIPRDMIRTLREDKARRSPAVERATAAHSAAKDRVAELESKSASPDKIRKAKIRANKLAENLKIEKAASLQEAPKIAETARRAVLETETPRVAPIKSRLGAVVTKASKAVPGWAQQDALAPVKASLKSITAEGTRLGSVATKISKPLQYLGKAVKVGGPLAAIGETSLAIMDRDKETGATTAFRTSRAAIGGAAAYGNPLAIAAMVGLETANAVEKVSAGEKIFTGKNAFEALEESRDGIRKQIDVSQDIAHRQTLIYKQAREEGNEYKELMAMSKTFTALADQAQGKRQLKQGFFSNEAVSDEETQLRERSRELQETALKKLNIDQYLPQFKGDFGKAKQQAIKDAETKYATAKYAPVIQRGIEDAKIAGMESGNVIDKLRSRREEIGYRMLQIKQKPEQPILESQKNEYEGLRKQLKQNESVLAGEKRVRGIVQRESTLPTDITKELASKIPGMFEPFTKEQGAPVGAGYGESLSKFNDIATSLRGTLAAISAEQAKLPADLQPTVVKKNEEAINRFMVNMSQLKAPEEIEAAGISLKNMVQTHIDNNPAISADSKKNLTKLLEKVDTSVKEIQVLRQTGAGAGSQVDVAFTEGRNVAKEIKDQLSPDYGRAQMQMLMTFDQIRAIEEKALAQQKSIEDAINQSAKGGKPLDPAVLKIEQDKLSQAKANVNEARKQAGGILDLERSMSDTQSDAFRKGIAPLVASQKSDKQAFAEYSKTNIGDTIADESVNIYNQFKKSGRELFRGMNERKSPPSIFSLSELLPKQKPGQDGREVFKQALAKDAENKSNNWQQTKNAVAGEMNYQIKASGAKLAGLFSKDKGADPQFVASVAQKGFADLSETEAESARKVKLLSESLTETKTRVTDAKKRQAEPLKRQQEAQNKLDAARANSLARATKLAGVEPRQYEIDFDKATEAPIQAELERAKAGVKAAGPNTLDIQQVTILEKELANQKAHQSAIQARMDVRKTTSSPEKLQKTLVNLYEESSKQTNVMTSLDTNIKNNPQAPASIAEWNKQKERVKREQDVTAAKIYETNKMMRDFAPTPKQPEESESEKSVAALRDAESRMSAIDLRIKDVRGAALGTKDRGEKKRIYSEIPGLMAQKKSLFQQKAEAQKRVTKAKPVTSIPLERPAELSGEEEIYNAAQKAAKGDTNAPVLAPFKEKALAELEKTTTEKTTRATKFVEDWNKRNPSAPITSEDIEPQGLTGLFPQPTMLEDPNRANLLMRDPAATKAAAKARQEYKQQFGTQLAAEAKKTEGLQKVLSGQPILSGTGAAVAPDLLTPPTIPPVSQQAQLAAQDVAKQATPPAPPIPPQAGQPISQPQAAQTAQLGQPQAATPPDITPSKGDGGGTAPSPAFANGAGLAALLRAAAENLDKASGVIEKSDRTSRPVQSGRSNVGIPTEPSR